jgi:hypothetical protein
MVPRFARVLSPALARALHDYEVMQKPTWWNDKHESTWSRMKGALERDWEQTKADWSTAGRDLNQGVGNTLKQMAGSEPIPPDDEPNDTWEKVEPAYRYGIGARAEYGAQYGDWDDRLDAKLADDWSRMQSGKSWAQVRARVQRAWNHGRDFEGSHK